MKKTLALTTMTALALVKTAAAENRIQYSMEDAAAAAEAVEAPAEEAAEG